MTSRINFDSASLIKDSMRLMAEYLYSLCPTAQLGVSKLEGNGKLLLLTRLNSFVNGSSGESMSSAYWGIISDSILIKLRNSTSTWSSSSSSSLSSTPSPVSEEESRMVYIMKMFCELNVRARTSFGGTANPVIFPPSAFFLSECLQSAFVYIRNVSNLSGKLSKYMSDENHGSNIDSSSPDREARVSSSKRSAVDISLPPTEAVEQKNKQIKLTATSTAAAAVVVVAAPPSQRASTNNPSSSGTHSPPSISEINLPKIEQIIRSFCQSKHIRANKTGEVLTKAPLQQQEQQDIFNILQQPFRRQESSTQQQHILRNPTAFLQSILPAEKISADNTSKLLSDELQQQQQTQKGRRKEFTRRQKKHPNRYVLTVQNPRFRPLSPTQSGGAAETIVKLTYGHIHEVRKVSDSPLLPPLPESEEGADGKKASSVFLSISLITALKGLEVLPNNRYRVQLNTFLSDKKKLSRNTTSLYEALWVFEISLLISDEPKVLDRLLRDGNYSSLSALSCLGFFRSPIEYYFELLRMLLVFFEHGLYFKNELVEAAIMNFDLMKPCDLVEDNVAQSIGKGSFELSSGVLLSGSEKELLSFRPMYGIQSQSIMAMMTTTGKTDSGATMNSLPTGSSSSSSCSAPDDDNLSEDEDNDLGSVSSSDLVDKSTKESAAAAAAAAGAKEPVNVDLEPLNLSSAAISLSPSSSASALAGQQESAAIGAEDPPGELVDTAPLPPSVPPGPVPADSNPLVNNLKQRVAGYRNGLSLKEQGLTCRNFRSSFFQALQISDSAPFHITLSANTPECFEQKMRPVVSMLKHVAR